MSPPAVVARIGEDGVAREIRAAFEEEAVPLLVEPADGESLAAARTAARRSPLGIGIGRDARRLVVALGTGPAEAYLEAPLAEARALGHRAARLAARRPMETPS